MLTGRVDGRLDAEAEEAAALCAPLHTDDHTGDSDGVERLTNNTAELKAIVVALRHVRTCPTLRGRAALIRYDSKYAALITCGVWRARSNKALAETARTEWALTRTATRGRLWLSHVKGHSRHRWNDCHAALQALLAGQPDLNIRNNGGWLAMDDAVNQGNNTCAIMLARSHLM